MCTRIVYPVWTNSFFSFHLQPIFQRARPFSLLFSTTCVFRTSLLKYFSNFYNTYYLLCCFFFYLRRKIGRKIYIGTWIFAVRTRTCIWHYDSTMEEEEEEEGKKLIQPDRITSSYNKMKLHIRINEKSK